MGCASARVDRQYSTVHMCVYMSGCSWAAQSSMLADMSLRQVTRQDWPRGSMCLGVLLCSTQTVRLCFGWGNQYTVCNMHSSVKRAVQWLQLGSGSSSHTGLYRAAAQWHAGRGLSQGNTAAVAQ